jgi:hypothetical protein
MGDRKTKRKRKKKTTKDIEQKGGGGKKLIEGCSILAVPFVTERNWICSKACDA